MNENVVYEPRRVVPRWRNFATTAALGEIGPLTEIDQPAQSVRADIGRAKQAWTLDKNVFTAGEMLTAALIEGDSGAIFSSASYLVREDVVASSFAKDIARRALGSAVTDLALNGNERFIQNAILFDKKVISTLRASLRLYPYDAIRWAELALAFAIIGKVLKARKAILTALKLAPNDRFVLRCATRFFVHHEEPDIALEVLNRAPRVKTDSWLLAAHISVAAIVERSSRLFKQAKSIFSNKDFLPLHLSELGAALATEELKSGNTRSSKKFFKDALVKPTENATAQALWAMNHLSFDYKESILNLPRTFEANARALVYAGKWDRAIDSTGQWQQDEPFSARPAILGSFLAGLAHEDHNLAIKFVKIGLQANPTDPYLLNNYAFSLACLGNIADARIALDTIKATGLALNLKPAIFATRGLIEFRAGNVPEGRKYYDDAISLSDRNDLRYDQALATINLAQEELRIDPSGATKVVRKAEDLAKNVKNATMRLALSKLLDKARADVIETPQKPADSR